MRNITKISEITYEDVAEYLRLSEVTEGDQNTLNNLIGIAKTFIMNYTGISEDDMR